MNFSTTPEAQANRKFWLLFIIAFLGIIGSYYGGYRMGRYLESLECTTPRVETRASK